jgi:hypothetical protein
MTHIEDRTEVVRETEQTSEPMAPVTRAEPVGPTVPAAASSARTYVRRSTMMSPSGAEVAKRVVYLLFGLIQIDVVLRILLLLVDARQGNGLVRFILDTSQWFVGPFDGILRTNALQASGAVLDLAAIVALIGWTVLELIVLWALNIFRREPA